MSKSHYFYLPLGPHEVQVIIEAHQESFNDYLDNSFSDDELHLYDHMLDSLAAVDVGPILSELSFDDFYSDPCNEKAQRHFFDHCRSVVTLDNLPFLESNPFQVTYLLELLKKFNEALVDRGGVCELQFKADYVAYLSQFKNVETLLDRELKPHSEGRPWKGVPVEPIDFLVLDVYKEVERLSCSIGTEELWKKLLEHPLKIQKLLKKAQEGKVSPSELYKKSGLQPKEFDDLLERLKFILKQL